MPLVADASGFKKVLIANRGACGCRIIRTCQKLGIDTVAIYTSEDRHSLHVKQAVENFEVSSYLAQDEIIKVAQKSGAEGVHPGYGFLAENASFARAVESAGLKWIGPAPTVMDVFASKTTARAKAIECAVPVLSGSPALTDGNDALEWAEKVGYPVLLKPAGGGGGIGMKVCENKDELKEHFEQSAALASRLFADSSVFIERFIRNARHIEVQVFGDGVDEVVHLGERECSVQRRFQKIVEEAPSPSLTDAVRVEMFEASIRLCKSVKYNSAGTVEFVYDDDTQKFYFLEVNTRIQVEHGITEMINPGVDLVQWMLCQAHPATPLNLALFAWNPSGHAIELRICAEDPTKDFQPSSGVIGEFSLPTGIKGARFETWVFRGCAITPSFDSLILKVLQWGPSRSESIRRLRQTLGQVVVKGPPNNIPMLKAFLHTPMFATGKTYTNTLSKFKFTPRCVEVLGAGLSVTIQDYPGRSRRGLWRVGVPPSGPIDHLSARLANSLVGNTEDMAVLEVTVKGPSLKFHFDAVCAVSGADFEVTVNGIKTAQYASIRLRAGDVLKVDHLTSDCGTRAYIAVGGGFDVPQYLGSRSTFIKGGFGGYQGRALMAGDVIPIGDSPTIPATKRCLPSRLWPKMTKDWVIGVLPGPMANPDFMLDEDIEMLHNTKWSVHHNSNRLGIRLKGPAPKWARSDGGEGGSHPSNIHDCEYAIGTINFTGNMPIIIAHDGPSLGGFVCPLTIVKSHLWKIGQVKAGDTVRFELLSIQTAISSRLRQNQVIETLRDDEYTGETKFDPYALTSCETKAVLLNLPLTASHPGMQIRLAGDSYVLVEYGPMVLDIRLRIRIHVLEEKLLKEDPIGLEETAPGVRSLQIRYDPTILPLMDLCELISVLDNEIEDLSSLQIKSRIFHLPLAWNHSGVKSALEQYTKSVRSEAPYLPSNIEFVAKNNGVSVADVVEKVYRASYMCLGLGDVYLGACCAVPTDPRDRLVVPKFNPARTYTQEGTVGLGGAYMCIYPMNSPGGYQLVGRTLPIWNTWGQNVPTVFSPERPWMLEMFDQIRFYKADEPELERLRQEFRDGSYVPKIEHSTFNAGEYDSFLKSIQDEVETYQQLQRNSSKVQNQLEKESLARLNLVEDAQEVNEKTDAEMALDTLSSDLFEVVEAPVSSKVWSIKVKEGDVVSKSDLLVVLEAMKMEFNVKAGDAAASYTVHKLLVQHGQMVDLGAPVAILEKPAAVRDTESKTISPDDVQLETKRRPSLQIEELLQAYRSGCSTPVKVINEIYDAMEARGTSKGNIWIELGTRDRVLEAAKALEGKSPSDTNLPLYGIPFAVKDNYDVEGWNTTAACPEFKYLPHNTAFCIQKLLDAGAIMIGKTNLDQFATGLNGTRSPYGACENSFDPKYISGGSSSGSAVACALGFCSFSLGTDTAGSGRIPAALNNLIGLKPTRGRISCRGMVPACRSLDCPSVFALTAADAAMVLGVMEGFDSQDEYSRITPPIALKTTWEVKSFRFGVPSPEQLHFFGNVEGPRLFEEACALLEKVGGERIEVDYRLFKEAADLLYEGPWVAERLAVIEEFMREHPNAVLETTKNITTNGNKFTAVDVFKSMYRLEAIKKQIAPYWQEMDFLVTPTAGQVYTIEQMQADPVQLNTNLGHYMNFMNLLDMAAVAIPTGFLANKMPFGVTVSSPAFSDHALLQLAVRYQGASELPVGANI